MTDEIDVAALLYKAADAIRLSERLLALHDCNDCGRPVCQYIPDPGQPTRINCPHWERRQTDGEE